MVQAQFMDTLLSWKCCTWLGRASIASTMMFAGCVEKEAPVSTPTPTETLYPETTIPPTLATRTGFMT